MTLRQTTKKTSATSFDDDILVSKDTYTIRREQGDYVGVNWIDDGYTEFTIEANIQPDTSANGDKRENSNNRGRRSNHRIKIYTYTTNDLKHGDIVFYEGDMFEVITEEEYDEYQPVPHHKYRAQRLLESKTRPLDSSPETSPTEPTGSSKTDTETGLEGLYGN